MTITTLAIATLSPFMVADAQEQVELPAETPAAVTYDWDSQVTPGISEKDFETGATGTFSYIPGGAGAMCVDDWNLA